MRRGLRTWISATLLVCLLAGLAGCGAEAAEPAEEAARYDAVDFVMGTVVSITIYTTGEDVTGDIPPLLSGLEDQWISWRKEGSELARINANAGTPTALSDQMAAYIEKALAVAKDSGGAFDPTLRDLSALWDFESGNAVVPPEAEIAALLPYVGYEKISLDGSTVLLPEGTGIDLGAIGKGFGCDAIQAYLEASPEITGALINIGGSSTITYGTKDDGQPWKIAVQDPRDPTGYLGALTLTGTWHVSTSGDYDRYFEKDGVRYHHILDPQTGYPAGSGLMSVTVISDGGGVSDALSTACFVLGPEASMALLEQYGAEAIFVDVNKNVTVTDGIRAQFELTAADYRMV